MPFREKFQRLLVGDTTLLASHIDTKSIILSGQLSVAMFMVGFLYLVLDLYNGVQTFILFYLAMMVASVTVILCIRKKRHQEAKLLLVGYATVLTYIFAANDTLRAGVYIYFIIVGLMAFALFGYSNKKIAFGFAALTLVLFLFAYNLKIKVITFSAEEADQLYSDEYFQISFVSNFLIGAIVCFLIVYFLLEVYQISERKILIQNHQLSKANEELDRFVYSASHDLRAPLSSLLGLIDVAGRALTDQERNICFEMMRHRIGNMETFIHDIIDYSRNARLAVKSEPINLLKLCRDLTDNHKLMQGHETVRVNYQIDEHLFVHADPLRMKVILNNLIGNAMKYQDLSKEIQWIEVNARQRTSHVEIEIKDNGIGIAPEQQTRVFEMFYRGSEQSKGSGLGLYIVKETIERLNGKVSLMSKPGEGSSFVITLPI